jgi:hypothetical protein
MMKPIAWMSPDGKFSTTEGKLFHIPLYTAPRELSEDEKEKAKTRILANPEVEQSHLTSNESISQPVAWIDEETACFVYSQSDYEELSEYDKGGLIPLYTAPRELSDDEIIADAYRYRWLRDRHENTVIDIFSSRTWTSVEDYKKQLNDLIDAEIAKATPACLEMAEIKKASEK